MMLIQGGRKNAEEGIPISKNLEREGPPLKIEKIKRKGGWRRKKSRELPGGGGNKRMIWQCQGKVFGKRWGDGKKGRVQ